MKNILIVYGSKYGQTKKIAEKMKLWFADYHVSAKTMDVRHISPQSLEQYDGIIIGAPIYATKPDKKIQEWITKNKEQLASKMTAFYLVCLNAANKNPKARVAEREILRKFYHQTHWTPRFTGIFAGALNYLEYGFLIRFIMKRISKAVGGPTDTSKNYEMTDWAHVRSFVRSFVEENPHKAFDSITLLEGEIPSEVVFPKAL